MRLELSKRTDIGLRALRHLAADGNGTPLSRSDLADAVGTTPAYLPHALTPLVRHGWIESRPGTNGGYLLRRDLEEISVLEIIEAIEGPIDNGTCVLRRADCSELEPCAMHAPWTRARDALRQELAATCVADCSQQLPHGGSNDS